MSTFEAIDSKINDSGIELAGTGNFEALPLQLWPAQWQSSAEFPTPQSVGEDAFSIVANDASSFSNSPVHYRLGERHLPVAPYRQEFLKQYALSPNLVASSDTGSGKSSQFGLFLLEAGAPRIFVTQPRIIAARELTDRARQNLGPHYENLAGYITGNASDSDCSGDARLIYVTEQLLFNMANRGQLRPDDTITVDEAHERTTPGVLLLGLIKELQKDSPNLRLIVSSATIDTNLFANYLTNPQTGAPAPVLILPGRTHPIIREESGESVTTVMRQQIREGANVLAFEPGVARMKRTAAKVQGRRMRETVHLLYGDQSATEQKLALTPEDHNHIVATRIGETSITPQGKDAVVDSGLSNVGRYKAGVRGLETIFSSKDTMLQRSGRVGRTKPGTYTLAVPADAPPPPAYEDRPDYEAPAIQNSSLATYIVELMNQGRKLEDLDLLESPTAENLQYDYLLLKRLGATALLGDELVLTAIGEATVDLRSDIATARSLVQAQMIAVELESERHPLMLQVAAVAALRQVNGILGANFYSDRRYQRQSSSKESFSNEQQSDVLFELDVFAAVYAKQQKLIAGGAIDHEVHFEKYLIANDILPSRYDKAVRNYEEICRRQSLVASDLAKPYGLQRRQIIECQIAGAEELFVRRTKRAYTDIRGENRIVGRKSIMSVPASDLVIGSAFDLSSMRASGRNLRRLISGGSAVSLEQLRQLAGHRITTVGAGYAISKKGHFVEKQRHYFDNDLAIGISENQPSPTVETRIAILTAMMTGVGPNPVNDLDTTPYDPQTPNATDAIKQWETAQKLEHRGNVNFNTAQRYESLIKKIVRQSFETVPLEVTDPAKLDHVIPKIFLTSLVRPSRKKDVPEVLRKSPDAIELPIADGLTEYIPVNYKNGIAYITVNRDQIAAVDRQDFAHLLDHHEVKLRFSNGKYQQFDAAFAHIDELRAVSAEKRARRNRNRELSAASSVTSAPSTERERSPITLEANEAKVRSINLQVLSRKKKKAAQKIGRRVISGERD